MSISMHIRGFVDLHTHGIGRYDTRTGDYEDILIMARTHAKAGTIAILPTIYAGTIDEMRNNLKAVRNAGRPGKKQWKEGCAKEDGRTDPRRPS